MSEQGYNGWSNYPTWCVNLWLSNDEGLETEARERVADQVFAQGQLRRTMSNPTWTVEQSHRYAVADMLKDWVRDDLAPDLGASFAADLLGYALDQVDWNELADAWLEVVAEVGSGE